MRLLSNNEIIGYKISLRKKKNSLRGNFLSFTLSGRSFPMELSQMDWNEIDRRLAALGKDRVWLADVTPYTWDTIRQALAPKGTARSSRMLTVLSRAIEDEEAKHFAKADLASVLEFEAIEWEQIVVLATRAGQEPKDWIRAQILAYLAWCHKASQTDTNTD